VLKDTQVGLMQKVQKVNVQTTMPRSSSACYSDFSQKSLQYTIVFCFLCYQQIYSDAATVSTEPMC
jgi:hypothetical protein